MTAPQDWRDRLKNFLISAGTNGRAQTEIIQTLGMKRVDVCNELEALMNDDKVQKFMITNKTVIWRATTKILEDLV